MDNEPKPICHEKKQAFVDCMFVHSRCVQSGKYSFDKCLELDQQNNLMHEDCTKRYRDFLTCHRQIVHNTPLIPNVAIR